MSPVVGMMVGVREANSKRVKWSRLPQAWLPSILVATFLPWFPQR